MYGTLVEVITQVREKKCPENYQVLVMWLKKTEEGIYTAELVSEVREAANLVCDLFGIPIFS